MGYKSLALCVGLFLVLGLPFAAQAQSPPFGSEEDQLLRAPSPEAGARDSISAGAFRPGSSLSGAVRTEDNRPVSNARVEIRDTTNGSSVAIGYTGPTGVFHVDNLPRGSYEIIADSGVSEAREQVRMDGAPMEFTLRLPHTSDSTFHGGQQIVSVQQLSVPERAQNAFHKAQESASKGKLDEARKEVTKALDAAPQFSEALALRGIINLQSGNISQAADDLQQAIQSNSGNALAYVAMGSIYNMKGQYDDALRESERGVALNPTAWQGHFEISKAQLGKGMLDACLGELNKAERLLGHAIASMHLIRGQAFYGMKSYAEAASEFEQYLKSDKDSTGAAEVQKALEQARAASEQARK